MDHNWIEILAPHDATNEKHLMALFALTGIPVSLLDVGCGTGAMVNLASKLGVKAYGIDLINRPGANFFRHDLCDPFSLKEAGGPNKVHMVISLEVAEHIPEDKHDIFCDTVANHVGTNGFLIFSSAHCGQEGESHVGVKPAPYWKEKFWNRGLTYQDYLTARVVLLWLNIKSPLYWLAENVMTFTG